MKHLFVNIFLSYSLAPSIICLVLLEFYVIFVLWNQKRSCQNFITILCSVDAFCYILRFLSKKKLFGSMLRRSLKNAGKLNCQNNHLQAYFSHDQKSKTIICGQLAFDFCHLSILLSPTPNVALNHNRIEFIIFDNKLHSPSTQLETMKWNSWIINIMQILHNANIEISSLEHSPEI